MARALPYPDGTFDRVVSRLMYLAPDDERRAALTASR
ncbi:class I SAM-dependent methyltransferase [Sorangium sp. So ce1335]